MAEESAVKQEEKKEWFNVQIGEHTNPDSLVTLGRLGSKEDALRKLNSAFAEENPRVGFTGKESLMLIEGNPSKKQYPLIISGEGNKRIATIGS